MFSLAPLSAAEDKGADQSSAIAIVVTVLILALLLTILGVWYYRRRTKVLQKDLQNRSVLYVENSKNPMRHNQNDLIISEPAVLEEESEGPPLVGVATSAIASNLPNNLLSKPRYEKNVNIDAFKLGMEEAQHTGRGTPINSGACGRSTPMSAGGACGRSTPLNGGGACGGAEDDFEEILNRKPLNINMFDEAESPVKNNNLLEHNRKINKPRINNLLKNTVDDEKEGFENNIDMADDNDDEIAIAKMSNYLGSYSEKK